MILRLNNKFYTKNSIESAIEAYSEVCEIKIINDSFEIELNAKIEEPMIGQEFCNFVLGVQKENLNF